MCSRNGHEKDGTIKNEQHQNGGKDKRRSSSSSKDRAINGKRVRDQDGYRQRAAAFCARLIVPDENAAEKNDATAILNINRKTSKLEVLMVSGRREGSCENYWVLPGGGVENLESTEQAVVRELLEEAGVLGQILFLIGKFIDEQRFHHTTLYFLTVQKTFDVWENCENGRERRWMGMDEARCSIKTNQLAMLEQSIGIIERTIFEHSNGTLNYSLPTLDNSGEN